MAEPSRADMIQALKSAQGSGGDADSPSRADMIHALKSAQTNNSISQAADLSSQKDFLGGSFRDTGRQGAPGEFLDSVAGAPVRSGLMAFVQNKGIGPAIQAGASQFGKDPAIAPSGFDVASQVGVQNPYAGAALATAIDVGAQLPVMEGAVAGSKALTNPAIGEALQKGTQAASDLATGAAKKMGKIFTPVSEETTARYLADPHTINSAPAREAISDEILNRKKTADANLTKAQEDLLTAKAALTENKGDARAGLQDQKFQAGQDLSEAQQNFNEKKQAFKEALKSNKLTGMASDATSAVQDLADKVSKGSGEGYEILGKSKAKTSVDPLVKSLQTDFDSMHINGVPKGPGEAQAMQAIRDEQMRLFNMTKESGGKLSMPQAKEMLQSIDQRTNYPSQAGDLSADLINDSLKKVRGKLNAEVRVKVPEYAEHMDNNVAPQTELLKTASQLYGTPEKAISSLNGIDSERGRAIHLPILKALSEETGHDLATPATHYLVNQKILSTPSLFDKAIEDLPEARALQGAKSKMQTLSNPEYSRSLIERSNAPYSQKLNASESAVESAKEGSKLFSGITPDSVTAKTKQLGGANDYGAKERFQKIDQSLGTNFEKQIQARNDLDQFSASDTHGSRKTLLGSVVGFALGSMMDHPFFGAEIGATAGHALDKFSGQVFKKMLDNGMKVGDATKATVELIQKTLSSQPVLEAISKKDPSAIDHAILGIVREGKIPSTKNVAVNGDDQGRGYDKWANDGLNKLIDHSGDKSLRDQKEELMNDPKAKKLLISASDLKPGSKAMDTVLQKLKTMGDKK